MTARRVLTIALIAAAAAAAAFAGWRQRRTPDAAYRDGFKAIARGDVEGAESAVDALRDAPGYESHRHLLQAARHLQSGDAGGAMRELTFVRATGDLREPAYLLKGEALYRLGRLLEAEQVLLRLDELHPDHPQVCRWLAAVYYDLGAMHDAVGRLEQLAKLEPRDFSPHRMLGMIHADFERYAKAIHHYQEALRRSPPEADRVRMTRELAQALVRERRYAEALEALKDVPAGPEVLVLQAECRWDLGEREEGRRLLTRAKEMKPDLRAVLLLEARMASDTDRPAEAVAPLVRSLELDRHDPEARYQLAMTYRRLGRTEDFERELARKEESQELRDRLTQLNLKAMDEPRNAEVRDGLAEVCERLGKPELAAMWRAAAEACRDTPPARR